MSRSQSTRVPLALALLLALAGAGCGGSSSETVVSTADTFDVVLRQALVENKVTPLVRPEPEDPALVELGNMLFHDKILSGNKNISCASCHEGPAGLGDGLPLAVGTGATGNFPDRVQNGAAVIARNAPHLFNVGLDGQRTMLHEGRVERDPKTGILKTNILELNIPVPFPPSSTAEKVVAQLTTALAMQAMTPVLSREEMRGVSSTADQNELGDIADADVFGIWAAIMRRLVGTETSPGVFDGGIAEYRTLFAAAYPGTAVNDLNFGHAARAIATYEREDFFTAGSPFDRYVKGELTALTDSQKRGMLTFYGKTKKGKCANCHGGPLLSNFDHHALAVPQLGPGKARLRDDQTPDDPLEDRGRALATDDVADNYKFRTPTLRNIALAAPYFHAGSARTLRDVMVHYNDIEAGARAQAKVTQDLPAGFTLEVDTATARIQARIDASKADGLLPQTLGLTEQEIQDLVAFMEALTDPTFGETPPASVPSGLPVED